MKEQRYDTLGGLSAPVLVYENYEEAEKVVPNGLLIQANNNMAYRGVLPVVREVICGLVEEASGVERESKVVGKTKAGKDILQWEADGAFTKRAMAVKGWEDLTQFQEQVDSICRAYKDGDEPAAPLAVDVKGAVRKAPEPKKLAAKYKIVAAKAITEGTLDRVNSDVLSKINKSYALTGDTEKMFAGSYVNKEGKDAPFNVSDKDAEALGFLIKEYQDWKSAQELLAI